MKWTHRSLLAAAAAAAMFSTTGRAQQKMLDPVGTFAVTTSSDTGAPMVGTLTVAVGANGAYTGRFEAVGLTAPVPIESVAVNSTEVLVVLKTNTTLALVYVARAADGSYKGTWHKLSDGIPATVVKR